MKEALSVFAFGIGALCFVVFVTVFKPTAGRCSPWDEQAQVSNVLTVRHGPHQFRTRNDHSTVQRTQSTRAFSSEVDTGSREENASKQESRASVLIQSEPIML